MCHLGVSQLIAFKERKPKDTKMATPLDFLQGHVMASKLVLFNTETCDYR